MNWVKKLFPMCVAVLSVMLLCGTGFAQNTQTVTLVPSATAVDPGASLDVNVNYDCTKKVGNFSIEVYYDAAMVTFGSVTVGYDQGILVNPPEHNATDSKIVISYLDIMGAWPTAALPLENVVTLSFTANADAAGTATFTIVDKAELPNMTFVGEPLNVTIGSVTPTATPVPIDAAAGISTAATVIDVNAAAYANERIAGAVTLAEVDLATLPKDTEILVYCRDAANAKAEADNLAAQGFTKVYYLDDTFANFAADTTTVTDDMVQYKLTVTVVGTGDVTGNSADGYHNRNTVVTLVATDVTWSGDTTDGMVTMDGAKTVTATFAGGQTCADVLQSVALSSVDPTTGDAPLTVNLTATVGGTADGYSWTVKGADGNDIAGYPQTSAANTFTVSALAAGSYTAIVTASNSTVADCSVVSVALPITVNEPSACTASFTITPNPATAGESVTFDASASTSSGSIVSYGWTFTGPSGNAGSPGGVTTSKPFNETGTYTAKLVITDDQGCTGELTQEFVVNQGGCDLVATIAANPAGGEEPLDVTLTANVTGGTADTYAWNVTKDGTSVATGAASTLALTALTAGNYTAFLTVSNATCSTEAGTYLIQVSPAGGMPDGDGDCNDIVDIYDALLAAIIDAGNPDNVEVCDYDMLDVDQNGVVDINDALAIAKYDVGLACGCVLDPKK